MCVLVVGVCGGGSGLGWGGVEEWERMAIDNVRFRKRPVKMRVKVKVTGRKVGKRQTHSVKSRKKAEGIQKRLVSLDG